MDSLVLSEGRNGSKARVRLVRWQGETAVEKNYSHRRLLVRHVLGPWLLDREERALRRLAGHHRIPALRARPSRQRLVMSRLEGQSLQERGAAHLAPGFFPRLLTLVQEIHGLGVAQGDIGAGDVLVDHDGYPGLVDFSVSVVRATGRPGGWLFRAAVAQDLRRVARLHARYSPADLSPQEQELLRVESGLHRWARRLRRLALPARRRRDRAQPPSPAGRRGAGGREAS